MSQNPAKPKRLGAPVYIALALVVVVLIVFVGAVISSQSNTPPEGEVVSANSYRARVDALLAIAQPENAEAALLKHTCIACHRGEGAVGPLWVGLAETASTRRPPMPADAYIYESIIFPGAYVVEGYADVMLRDIGDRISDQELADIIAFLLTPDAQ